MNKTIIAHHLKTYLSEVDANTKIRVTRNGKVFCAHYEGELQEAHYQIMFSMEKVYYADGLVFYFKKVDA